MSPLFFLFLIFSFFFFVVVLIGLSSLFFFYPRNYILDALSSFTVASAASIYPHHHAAHVAHVLGII
jgi:hypothetical protein